MMELLPAALFIAGTIAAFAMALLTIRATSRAQGEVPKLARQVQEVSVLSEAAMRKADEALAGADEARKFAERRAMRIRRDAGKPREPEGEPAPPQEADPFRSMFDRLRPSGSGNTTPWPKPVSGRQVADVEDLNEGGK